MILTKKEVQKLKISDKMKSKIFKENGNLGIFFRNYCEYSGSEVQGFFSDQNLIPAKISSTHEKSSFDGILDQDDYIVSIDDYQFLKDERKIIKGDTVVQRGQFANFINMKKSESKVKILKKRFKKEDNESYFELVESSMEIDVLYKVDDNIEDQENKKDFPSKRLPSGMNGRLPLFEEKEVEDTQSIKIIKDLDKKIKSELFNQDEAVDKVHKSVKIYMAGLKDSDKPIGSYLLVGPTGTGKTELAKLYAKNLNFDFVRFDMSEFGESHTASKFIGSPAGYVGYNDKTLLETKVGSKGKKVVLLLDEMEKSHVDIQKLFLQAMDNRKITLSNGRSIDFSNTLILMTSNLGISKKKSLGLHSEDKRVTLDIEQVKNFFLPEFIGRLSGIAEFNALIKDDARNILDKFILEFSKKIEDKKKCKLIISKDVKSLLVNKGFDPVYGARPLKNILQHELNEKIADLFISSPDLNSKEILVDLNKEEISVRLKDTCSDKE